MHPQRRLQDLISIGPAMLHDFELFGIRQTTRRAKAAKNVRALTSLNQTASGCLCSGYVRSRGGPGKKSAVVRGTMSVVVLESQAEGLH